MNEEQHYQWLGHAQWEEFHQQQARIVTNTYASLGHSEMYRWHKERRLEMERKYRTQ